MLLFSQWKMPSNQPDRNSSRIIVLADSNPIPLMTPNLTSWAKAARPVVPKHYLLHILLFCCPYLSLGYIS